MRNKDTGEFELVVGDKQLLSAFFIGVLLLAVVFALGYLLGQSSPKSARVTAPDSAVIPNNSAAESRPEAASPAASTPAASTPAQSEAASRPADAPPQPTTVPAREAGASAPPPAKAAPPAEPENASYWQVLAGSQSSADAMTQTLKGQGFPASTRPGPNNFILVWVGPYTDKESLSRAKKQLEDAGMKPIRKP